MPTYRHGSISSPLHLLDELVWEILTWLPVKSLMRFKCVSKLWRSLIEEPAFAITHRHRGAFRGLLIFGSSLCRRYPDTDFFYLTLDASAKEISHHLTLDHHGTHMAYTDPVNGLICFYYRNHSFLYNVATRERLQLPDSECASQACTYHLGFDPVNDLYKLVKICPVYNNYDDGNPLAYEDNADFVRNLNCEVLTFGEGVKDSPFLWRTVDSPPWDMRTRGVCYDGVLYWCEREVGYDNHLIGFDLSKEKFFIFPMPSTRFYLMPFGYGLRLCLHQEAYCHRGLKATIICYHGGGTAPTELDIYLVEEMLYLIGVLPNGKILFGDMYMDSSFPPAVFYLYDSKGKEYEKIVVPHVTPSTYAESLSPHLLRSLIECGYISHFEENILSLRRCHP